VLRFVTALALSLVACSTGSESGKLHHPDLRLAELASSTEGSPALFTSYRSTGPVSWNQGWPWKLDLTGVAWDKSNTATAITPRHVVMASHYIRKAGQDLVFHDRTGKRHARRLVSVIHFKEREHRGDVAVGLLDRPLPESIRTYPLPSPPADEGLALVGAVALVTEQKRDLYFHRIARINGSHLGFRYGKSIPGIRKKRLIAGDSGHPSFILSKGELVLIETHTGGGAGSGPFYGSKDVQNAIRAIVKELDSGHTFRTVAIDKPTLADAALGKSEVPPPAPPIRAKPRRTSEQVPRSTVEGEPRRPRPRVVVPPKTDP